MPTLSAHSLTDVRWTENGRTAQYQNRRLYGITDGRGRWYSRDGIRPSCWDRKASAAEVAKHPNPAAAMLEQENPS